MRVWNSIVFIPHAFSLSSSRRSSSFWRSRPSAEVARVRGQSSPIIVVSQTARYSRGTGWAAAGFVSGRSSRDARIIFSIRLIVSARSYFLVRRSSSFCRRIPVFSGSKRRASSRSLIAASRCPSSLRQSARSESAAAFFGCALMKPFSMSIADSRRPPFQSVAHRSSIAFSLSGEMRSTSLRSVRASRYSRAFICADARINKRCPRKLSATMPESRRFMSSRASRVCPSSRRAVARSSRTSCCVGIFLSTVSNSPMAAV